MTGSGTSGSADASCASRRGTGYLTGVVASGNAIAMGLRLLSGLITAGLVLPETLGAFNGIGLVLVYAPLLQLGVLNGLNRELPYLVGRGDRAAVDRVAACALAVALACGAVAAVLAFGWAGVQAFLGQTDAAAGWASFALALACFFPSTYLRSTLRTASEFTKLSASQVIGALALLALTLPVYWWGYYGLCVRMLGATLIEFALLWHWRPIRVRPGFSKPALRHLLAVGLPIFAVGYLYSGWRSLDALWILNTLGAEPLGLFQLAVMTVAAGGILSASVTLVLYPRMSEHFGRTGDAKGALALANRPVVVLALVTLPLVVLAWVALPPLTAWLLPGYVGGVRAAQWSLATVYALSFAPPLVIFNVTRQQGRYALAILAGTGVFAGAVLVGPLVASDPLTWFAVAMALGTGVFVVVGNVLAQRGLQGREGLA